jgi:DNA repair protein RecO (recombination protein O)
MTYAASGIVLRRDDVREWDRLYTVFTREYGKLRLIAKGARRPRAKLAGSLEPYGAVDLHIAGGRTLDRVIAVSVERSGMAMGKTWDRFRAASFIGECADMMTRDRDSDPRMFLLLNQVFVSLENLDSGICVNAFVLRSLSLLGFAPRVDHCVDCRSEASPEQSAYAVSNRGGLICRNCRRQNDRGVLLTAADREMLRIQGDDFLPCPTSDAVRAFALAHLESQLPRPMIVAPFSVSPKVASTTNIRYSDRS